MTGMGTTVVNGEITGCIEVGDRGLQYGDGVFETIAVVEGDPQHWDLHMQRLDRGCRRLQIPSPGNTLLSGDFRKLRAGRSPQVLKIIVTRGVGGRGYRPPSGVAPTRILTLSAWPDYPAGHVDNGVTVRICTTRLGSNPQLAGIKHLNRLEQVLARSEWQTSECAEGLMLDAAGNVIEGTMSNLFVVRHGMLHTPVIVDSGIAGIMRQVVMEHCQARGTPVIESRLHASEIWDAEEMFLTNSLIGVWPVRRLMTTARQHDFPPPRIATMLRSQLRHALPPHAA